MTKGKECATCLTSKCTEECPDEWSWWKCLPNDSKLQNNMTRLQLAMAPFTFCLCLGGSKHCSSFLEYRLIFLILRDSRVCVRWFQYSKGRQSLFFVFAFCSDLVYFVYLILFPKQTRMPVFFNSSLAASFVFLTYNSYVTAMRQDLR